MRDIMENAGISQPAHLVNPEVHHDLPFRWRQWFVARGLDVNDPRHLRWVEGTQPGGHKLWTPQFEEEWLTFMNRELMDAGESGYSKQTILDFMNEIRARPRYQ